MASENFPVLFSVMNKNFQQLKITCLLIHEETKRRVLFFLYITVKKINIKTMNN